MIIREMYFQCEGVFMIVWLYILYALIAIVVIGIFLPNGIAGGLDNVPLLIVILSILLIVVLFKMIRYFRMFLIAKKHLKKCGFEITNCNIIPPFLGKKKCNIIAKKDDLVINVCILKVTKTYLTYHFDDINTIEIYKSTRLAIKPRVRQANIISRHVETKKVGIWRLSWKNIDKQRVINIVLFDKFPNIVSDSKNREDLGNGDKICDKIYIYNISGFERRMF